MSMDLTQRRLLEIHYRDAAQQYLRKLPLEHFMEATPQGTQRKITLESLDLVHARRPEVQFFNELLVQYPLGRRKKPGQVVPDNMVVVHPEPIEAEGSFDVPLQPVGPFWVLEYVSRHSKRKDYQDSFTKYERDLKIPYCLMFHPEDQELSLFRHDGSKYVSVKPNEQGRLAIPELELEVGLLDGWVRFWYCGELLALPADLQRELDEVRAQLAAARQQVVETARQLDETARQLDETARQLEEERQARLAAEAELARLREQLGRIQR